METPMLLETATKLLDAVESRLPTMEATKDSQEWIWLGRALRALLCAERCGQDHETVKPLGNRLMGLVERLREKDVYAWQELESYFLNASTEAAAEKQVNLARCQKRDDVMSLECVGTYFCDDLIVWDSHEWEMLNDRSEDDQCELLRASDAGVDQRPATETVVDVPSGRMVPAPALRVFDGATASLDPRDPCGDGWLACLALWNEGNHWWVEYVRADLADVLARSATNRDEVGVAYVMMPEVPAKAPDGWPDLAREHIEAGRSPNSDARVLCEVGEPDGMESEY